MLPQGMFSVAVATVLFPTLAAARHPRRPGGLPRHVSLGPAPDQLPALPGRRRLDRARRADRAPPLRARRVRARPDDVVAGGARGLLDRPHLQRDDADAEPRLLQPPGAVEPDRVALDPRVLNVALYAVFYRVGAWGIPFAISLANIAASGCCSSRSGAGSAARPDRDRAVVRPRHVLASAVLAAVELRSSGGCSTRRSAARSSAQLVSLGVALVAGGAVYLVACRALGVREMATLLSLRDRSRRD